MGSGKKTFPLRSLSYFSIRGKVERQVDVNLVGTMRVTKLCLPLLKVTLINDMDDVDMG